MGRIGRISRIGRIGRIGKIGRIGRIGRNLHLPIPDSDGGSLRVGGRIVEKGDVSGMDALTKNGTQPMAH